MTEQPDSGNTERRTTFSRRGLFGAAGAAVATGVAGYAAHAWADDSGQQPAIDNAAAVDFYGGHQAGIVTPAQDRLHFATFDLLPTVDRDGLIRLLKEWTAAAAKMTAGQDVGEHGAVSGPDEAPPEDTGEALGLPPSRLTLTIGFGPSLFTDAGGKDRFGLAGRRPPALVDLPLFVGDEIKPERSGGDIAVQACSDDPQVAVHAIRNLARIGFGTTSVRYSQLGFGRTSSTSRTQVTPRNLMGFKDGTNNLDPTDAEVMGRQVWVNASEGPDWMVDGSYLVARRIMIRVELWDRTGLAEQEQIMGRRRASGAPLGGLEEHDPVIPERLPQRARAVPAPRLQLRQRRGRPRPAGGRALLPGLPARPAQAVRAGAAPAGGLRHPQRVHAAHRQRDLRGAPRDQPRRLRGRDPAGLSAPLSPSGRRIRLAGRSFRTMNRPAAAGPPAPSSRP
jgi:deferrochelatase/peroxidase EfeB